MSLTLRLALLAFTSALLVLGVMYWHACAQPEDATALALRQFDPGARPAGDLRLFTAGSGATTTLAAIGETILILVFLGGPIRRSLTKPKPVSTTNRQH